MKKALLALAVAASLGGVAIAQTATTDYDTVRKSLVTTAKKAASPQDFDNKVPKGVEKISYASKDGNLMAWVLRPKGAKGPLPVVVYAHGGFAIGDGDDTDAKPFVDAGYIVMMPTVRGENGNPGNFELFLGEVDDVIAAGRKATTLPGADPSRVYLFGHSIGGGLATLVSLSKDTPYKAVGTTGGNYPVEDCAGIAKNWGTFDPQQPGECAARFPNAYLSSLKTPLYAFVGDQDRYSVKASQLFQGIANENYHLAVLKGDHFTVVKPSIAGFIAAISK